MFVKPKITSTPHLIIVQSSDTAIQACSISYGSCPSSFSCSPYIDANCVDASYTYLPFVVIGLVVSILS